MKPQVGEAETNAGVSQNDAGHVFGVDDVITYDVTRDNIIGESKTQTGINILQESRVFLGYQNAYKDRISGSKEYLGRLYCYTSARYVGGDQATVVLS